MGLEPHRACRRPLSTRARYARRVDERISRIDVRRACLLPDGRGSRQTEPASTGGRLVQHLLDKDPRRVGWIRTRISRRRAPPDQGLHRRHQRLHLRTTRFAPRRRADSPDQNRSSPSRLRRLCRGIDRVRSNFRVCAKRLHPRSNGLSRGQRAREAGSSGRGKYALPAHRRKLSTFVFFVSRAR